MAPQILFLSLLACFGRGTPDDSAPAADDTSPGDTSPLTAELTFDGDAPKNVLLIGIDTLRRDYIGHYNGTGAAPFVSARLGEAVSLEDHRSNSNSTWPSIAAITTGAYNLDLGFIPTSAFDPPVALPDSVTTVSDYLSAEGYSTWFAGSTGFMADQYNVGSRYEVSEQSANWTGTQVTERALELADAIQGEQDPWFLHVHYLDPHFPYNHPAEYNDAIAGLEPIDADLTTNQGVEAFQDWDQLSPVEQDLLLQHVDAYYKAAIEYTDDSIEALWQGLEDRGLMDDTLVVFWSDHGEQFYEHGEFTHGVAIYGEETWAIGGFWAENLQQAEWTGQTTHIDLMPTVFTALGIDLPEQFTGAPLGNAPDYRYTFRAKSDETMHAVERDGKRLIYDWSGAIAYFDIDADPGETNDLYDATDPTVQELWALLKARVELASDLIDETDRDGNPIEPVWPD